MTAHVGTVTRVEGAGAYVELPQVAAGYEYGPALYPPLDQPLAGDTVVVSSPEVKEPVAVRYAFSMNPHGANLYNRDGLPAGPFRTDDW